MEKILVLLFILMIVAALSKSITRGELLQTVSEKPVNPADVFTLILYGGAQSNDLETVVILDKENDRYTFEPYAAGFRYVVKKRIPAQAAFEEAGRFVSRHHAFHRSQTSAIVDALGTVIGYEVRPLYLPVTFGVEDVLDVEYRLKNSKVSVFVRLKPSIDMTQL